MIDVEVLVIIGSSVVGREGHARLAVTRILLIRGIDADIGGRIQIIVLDHRIAVLIQIDVASGAMRAHRVVAHRHGI